MFTYMILLNVTTSSEPKSAPPPTPPPSPAVDVYYGCASGGGRALHVLRAVLEGRLSD